MITPTMTVNHFLDLLPMGCPKTENDGPVMAGWLFYNNAMDWYDWVATDDITIAAHWQWPLDALIEAYKAFHDELSVSGFKLKLVRSRRGDQ